MGVRFETQATDFPPKDSLCGSFKGQLVYRAYIGISDRGTLVGVHPTIP